MAATEVPNQALLGIHNRTFRPAPDILLINKWLAVDLARSGMSSWSCSILFSWLMLAMACFFYVRWMAMDER